MKVLVVHGRYRSAAPSGENNVVDRESAALAASGHVVERFERASDDIAAWSAARKVALPLNAVWNPAVRRQLADLLRMSRPDVVHVHNTFPLLSPTVLHACRDADVPVVATLHNYKLLCASGDFFRNGRPCHDCARGLGTPAVAHGCYRGSRLATLPVVAGTALHRQAWRELVSAYVFISAAHRDLMADLDLPHERVFVKHNFVPDAGVRSDREHLVAYVGRLDEAKGVPLLQGAWDRFRLARPRSTMRLVVAGGGPLAGEVARWAAGHPSVDVTGLLAPEAATLLLGRARAVVVPSQWEETFGLVAVEAMAAGVAPVAPARGSFPELITTGHDGALFEPGSVESLASVLADVDARPEHYTALGRRARSTYELGFRDADNITRLLDIYRFAVAHPVCAPAQSSSEARS